MKKTLIFGISTAMVLCSFSGCSLVEEDSGVLTEPSIRDPQDFDYLYGPNSGIDYEDFVIDADSYHDNFTSEDGKNI